MLWTTFFFNQQAVGYITTMYKAYGQSFITNDQFLAIVGSVSSIFNTLGRMFWGGFADKTSFRVCTLQISPYITRKRERSFCRLLLLAAFGRQL
jgi:hypothetical protein